MTSNVCQYCGKSIPSSKKQMHSVTCPIKNSPIKSNSLPFISRKEFQKLSKRDKVKFKLAKDESRKQSKLAIRQEVELNKQINDYLDRHQTDEMADFQRSCFSYDQSMDSFEEFDDEEFVNYQPELEESEIIDIFAQKIEYSSERLTIVIDMDDPILDIIEEFANTLSTSLSTLGSEFQLVKNPQEDLVGLMDFDEWEKVEDENQPIPTSVVEEQIGALLGNDNFTRILLNIIRSIDGPPYFFRISIKDHVQPYELRIYSNMDSSIRDVSTIEFQIDDRRYVIHDLQFKEAHMKMVA